MTTHRPALAARTLALALGGFAAVLGAPLAAPALAQDGPLADRRAAIQGRPDLDYRRVDWDAVRGHLRERRLLRTRPSVRAAESARFQECHVPILLPSLAAVRERREQMALFPQRDQYAAFLDRGDHTIEIIGTRIVRRAERSRPVIDRMREGMAGQSMEDGVLVAAGDYGIDLSFSRYGIAYTISIQCERGAAETPACRDEGYIRSLADTMAFAGGTPEDGSPLDDGVYADEILEEAP